MWRAFAHVCTSRFRVSRWHNAIGSALASERRGAASTPRLYKYDERAGLRQFLVTSAICGMGGRMGGLSGRELDAIASVLRNPYGPAKGRDYAEQKCRDHLRALLLSGAVTVRVLSHVDLNHFSRDGIEYGVLVQAVQWTRGRTRTVGGGRPSSPGFRTTSGPSGNRGRSARSVANSVSSVSGGTLSAPSKRRGSWSADDGDSVRRPRSDPRHAPRKRYCVEFPWERK